MNTSESTANIGAALVAAQAELANPAKSQQVNAGAKRYKFAPLPDILEAVRPVLTKNGLAVVQEAAAYGALVAVKTRLFHASGEWIEYGALCLPAGNDAQAAGSAITYARRYSLTAALGIAADEDDDGKQACPAQSESPATATTTAASTARSERAPVAGGSSAPGHGGTERDAGGSGVAEEGASGSSAQHLKPEPHAPDMHAVKAGSSLTRCAYAGCPVAGKATA